MKSLYQNIIRFATGSIAGGIFNFITFFVAAKWVGPEKWGIWMICNIVIKLSPMVQLGVTESVQRQVPILNGRGEIQQGQLLQDSSLALVCISGALSSLLVALLLPNVTEIPALLVWLFAPIVFFNLINFNFGAYFRSNYQFGKASILSLTSGVLSLLSLLFAYQYSLKGFIIGQVVRFGLVTLISYLLSNRRIMPRWKPHVVMRLIQDGFPVLLVSLVSYCTMLLDRMVISSFFDLQSLGHYGLAYLLINPMLLVFGSMNSVFYSKLSFDFGDTGSLIALRQLRTLSSLQSWVFGLQIGIVYLLMPVMVDFFLPAYQAGVPTAKVLLLGHIFFFSLGLLNNALNTLNAQRKRLAVYAMNIVFGFFLNFVFLFFFKSIWAVAVASAVSFMLLFLQLHLVFNRQEDKSLHFSPRVIFTQFVIPCISVSIIYVVAQILDCHSWVVNILVQIASFLILMGLVFYFMIFRVDSEYLSNEFRFSRR